MPRLRRSLNLFNSTTSVTTDNQFEEYWEEPRDHKVTILLGQGIIIAVLVALALYICGRIYCRRMELLRVQELNTISIANGIMSDSDAPANGQGTNNTDGRNEERTWLKKIMNILATPVRFIHKVVNEWASSPSTDFEHYDRILRRMEREKEAKMESVEERTKRLMNIFVKEQCLWEIEDKHFIPPCSTNNSETSDCSLEVTNNEVDIESDLNSQIDRVYSHLNEKMTETKSKVLHFKNKNNTNEAKEVTVGEESNELDAEIIDADNKDDHTKDNSIIPRGSGGNNYDKEEVRNDQSSSIEESDTTSTNRMLRTISSSDDNSNETLPKFTSCVDTPGYLYINMPQSNRIRPNSSSGSLPTTTKIRNIVSSSSLDSFLSISGCQQRVIPNQCAICLCDYAKGDIAVFSSNTLCQHAFHRDCIVEWLVKMQEGTPCPCCRQTFVHLENGDDDREDNTDRERGRDMSEEEFGALRLRLQLGLQRGRAFDVSVVRF